MQEFLLVLVVIFVLFKVFGRPNVINFNNYTNGGKKQDPSVKVSGQKPSNSKNFDDSEYVDYEEIK